MSFLGFASETSAQAPTAGPPAVGVIRAEEKPLIETSEFLGRIQAIGRVNLVARVTGFLEKRFFDEGMEVKGGALLYRIEQPPFKADVQAKQSVVDQLKAQLENAKQTLERAKSLLTGPADQQSTYDSALASERSLEAQVLGAEAQLQQSQINLGYTEISAPIAGKIGLTLSPALSEVFLRPSAKHGIVGRILRGIDSVRGGYSVTVRLLLRVAVLAVILVVAFAGGAYWAFASDADGLPA